MSEEFSDDLSDPTPSPSPVPSPSKPTNARRGTAGTTGAGRGKPSSSASNSRPAALTHRKSTSAASAAAAQTTTHSRTHSLANSSNSHSKKTSKKKANAASGSSSSNKLHSNSPADDEDGSELSPVPSEEEKEEEEEEEEEEDDEHGGFASNTRPVRPGGRATRQTSAASMRGRGVGRSGLGRGVIPAPMWEWAKKKNYKKAKASTDEDENTDDDEAEQASNPDDQVVQTGKTSRASQDADQHADAQDEVPAEDEDEHAALEDDPMENATKANSEEEAEDQEKSEGEKSDEDEEDEKAIEKMTIPLVKVEPPPSAVLPSALLPDGQEDEHQDDDDENAEEEGDGEDLQSADRQPALDALAILELKFALLRQRIYQDKMDELGKEEQMIQNGTHPEMLHTISELEKRRDKRIVLAEKRRKKDMELAVAVRKCDEDGIWSWWMVTKDEVQAELITETSRKRRRVERERRALLDPFRSTLNSFPSEPPRPSSREPVRPSMKTIVSVALKHPYARLPNLVATTSNGIDATKGSKSATTNGVAAGSNGKSAQQAMPSLSQLGEFDIQDDLDLLRSYKRGFTEPDAGLQGLPPGASSGAPLSNASNAPGVAAGGNEYPRYSLNPSSAAGYDTDPSREPQYADHSGGYQGYPGHGTQRPPGMNGSGRERESRKHHTHNFGQLPSSAYNTPTGPQHRQPADSNSYPSPGLGLQNMQRPPENLSSGISAGMPVLPPAPSTLPSSSAGNKHHHHHHHHHHPAPASSTVGGTTSHHSQHPSLSIEPVRRERDSSLSREKTYSSAANAVGMGVVAPNSSYVPQTSAGAAVAVAAGHMPPTGRVHSHSISHYHHQSSHGHAHSQSVGHTHSSRQRAEGHSHSHTHTMQVHHHSHSHTHGSSAPGGAPASGSSHAHVIHNHGHSTMAPPPQTPPAQYREGISTGGAYRGESKSRGSTTTSSKRNRQEDANWKRSGYEEDAQPSAGLHPSLSQSGYPSGQTTSASARRRDSWSDREETERMRDRERARDREKDKLYSQSQPGGMMSISSLSGSAAAGQYPTTTRDSHASRYAYGSGPGYSPPNHPRRSSPPPTLPAAPSTMGRYAHPVTGTRQSPANEGVDVPGSHAEAASHSPTSSLNPPGFNPWSAGPRSTTSTVAPRPYSATSSPAVTAASSTLGGSKITPPLPSASTATSTSASTILPRMVSTSPVLPRPPTAPPRPSISPAPRPPSSSSIHAILQPPRREKGSNITSPQPLAPLVGVTPKGEKGESMDIDQPPSAPLPFTLPPLSNDGNK